MYVIKWVQRSELGWGVTGADQASCGKGLVIHYNGPNTNLNGHKECINYWKNVRIDHMDKSDPNHGWLDVGYSYAACKHGYILVGRGFERAQAAQGTTAGNREWHSVTLMCGNTDEVTTLQINAVRALRQHLMSKGKGGEVKGHRDFFATDCPGNRLYGMLSTFKLPPQEEVDEEVPEYVNVENTDPLKLPANVWVSLSYDREWSDANHHHWDEGSPNFVVGGDKGAFYIGHSDVTIDNLIVGSEISFRTVEVDDTQAIVEFGKVDTRFVSDTSAELRYPIDGFVNSSRKLRVQVLYTPAPDGDVLNAEVEQCQAVVFIWPKP